MRRPKLKFVASALQLLILGFFACNKPQPVTPPSNTPAPIPIIDPVTDCRFAANGPAKVVCLSNAFLATLNTSQLASAQLSLTKINAVHWSNLPCGPACRNGLEFINMTPAQVTDAKAILAAATGTANDEGYSTINQIIQADSVLNATSSTPYSPSYYFIAFLGMPSLTGSWQLQFGGHNLAINITYKNGVVTGTTPMFQGAEPYTGNTLVKGTTNSPLLSSRQSALVAMFASLSADQLANARLSTIFTDLLLGPGNDGNFPTTKAGVRVSTLNQNQQDLVLSAIELWVENADSVTAAALIPRYMIELSDTYISYSNTPYLTSFGDYVRIDGPSVWIEFICVPGVVTYSQMHYNSIWRDHKRDYGANFFF
jgi:hypothetical protein